MSLQGSLVAIVTPMFPDGSLDIQALHGLIDFHISEGTDGIVIVGTTGESATVNFDEHCQLIDTTIKHANKRIPVIAGTGANSTQEAIDLTKEAKRLGANACLLVTPYYNKPNQIGLFKHFSKIANEVEIHQILYNVPSRTSCDLHNDTVLRLSEVNNIVGIKDATGDMTRGIDLIKRLPAHFLVFSGDDATALSLMLLGAKGIVSVTANVAPKLMHKMCECVRLKQNDKAIEINQQLFSLHTNLFIESNPIPVKWALKTMGLIKEGIRLPLVELSQSHHKIIQIAMKEAHIQ
ncbi:MAG: 4-hydroxy-tetrahydrodipicolinate synthase [Candidatus Methylopumilus sp.]|nr:4-hydroxy-tetrahydrodipicolinate synthase [Candidatus Methylopumilus sp.]